MHTAAQPSHDWAASEPQTDFTINANGTLNLLEATRQHCPDATFVFASTNKVYGDRPNSLPLVENETGNFTGNDVWCKGKVNGAHPQGWYQLAPSWPATARGYGWVNSPQ